MVRVPRETTPDIERTFKSTLDAMLDDESEIVTIIVGEDGDIDFAERLANELMDQNEFIDVDVIEGHQPVYHYIFAVE